jgi:hypothetical protein
MNIVHKTMDSIRDPRKDPLLQKGSSVWGSSFDWGLSFEDPHSLVRGPCNKDPYPMEKWLSRILTSIINIVINCNIYPQNTYKVFIYKRRFCFIICEIIVNNLDESVRGSSLKRIIALRILSPLWGRHFRSLWGILLVLPIASCLCVYSIHTFIQ